MITYKKIYKVIVSVLFALFMALYIAEESGYYQAENYKAKSLTEEKIKEFEDDVKKGKNINVDDYLVDIKKDYSNNVSNFGKSSSNVLSKCFKEIINKIFSGLDDSN